MALFDAGVASPAREAYEHAEPTRTAGCTPAPSACSMPDTDVLTPTMKLKRRGVHERYPEQIDLLYS